MDTIRTMPWLKLLLICGTVVVVVALITAPHGYPLSSLSSPSPTPVSSLSAATSSPTPIPTPSPTPIPTPVDDRVPFTITGSGTENSAPFHLDGTYAVTWTATPSSDVGCFHAVDLVAVDPDMRVSETLGSALLDSAAPQTGTTYLYNIEPGDYFARANSGCDWSLVFTPA